MKKIIFITTVLFQFFAVTSSAAKGIGGSGGGANATTQITVEVCRDGNSVKSCRKVTYELRGTDGKAFPAMCRSTDDQERAVPCQGADIFPNWLRKLNDAHKKMSPEERAIEDQATFFEGD